MTVEVPGVLEPTAVRVAFVSNTSTWTYLGSRAVHTNLGPRSPPGWACSPWRALTSAPSPTCSTRSCARAATRRAGVVRHDAVALVRVSCEIPVALQLDGDHLGERSVEFLSVPEALRVVV